MEEKKSPTREPRRRASPQRNAPRVPASGGRSTYNNWASHQSRGASNSGSNGSQTGSNVEAAAHTDSNRAGYRRAAHSTTNSASNSSLSDTSPPNARAGPPTSQTSSRNPALTVTARQGIRFRRRGGGGESSTSHSSRASTETSHRQTGAPLPNPFLPGPRGRRSRQPPTSGMTSDPSSSDSSPSDLPSDFLGSLMMPSSMSLPRASFITSLEGTEDFPIELSPDPPDHSQARSFLDLNPPTFLDLDSPTMTGTPGMSDEEFARRLQQEEWESASSIGGDGMGDDFVMPSVAGLRGLHQPYRPPRAQGRQASIPRSRHAVPSFTDRNAGGPESLDFMSMLGPLLMGGATRRQNTQERNLPFLLEMLRASGMLEMMQVETMLDSGTGGDYEQLLALAEQIGEVNKGLTPEEILQFPTTVHKGEKLEGAQAGCEDQCSICLTDYQEGDSQRGLPCTHAFHTACVDQWLATNPTCPVCRADLKPRNTATSTS